MEAFKRLQFDMSSPLVRSVLSLMVARRGHTTHNTEILFDDVTSSLGAALHYSFCTSQGRENG